MIACQSWSCGRRRSLTVACSATRTERLAEIMTVATRGTLRRCAADGARLPNGAIACDRSAAMDLPGTDLWEGPVRRLPVDSPALGQIGAVVLSGWGLGSRVGVLALGLESSPRSCLNPTGPLHDTEL